MLLLSMLQGSAACRNICPRGVPAGGDVTQGAPDITYALKSLPINLSCLVGSEVVVGWGG